MVPPFTLTVDWLSFTVPSARMEDAKHVLGGDWVPGEGGFRGYPKSWITADGLAGVGLLGTGALRSPQEVHGDLSGGIVSTWPLEQVKTVIGWIVDQEGHLTRLDCAFDDRASQVTLEQIKAAVAAGQCLTRAEQFRVVAASDIGTGTATGETLYFGSPTSQTMLRVYNKRLEMQQKGRENWQDYGIRWELQLKKDRAHACAVALRCFEEEEWRRYLISVVRSYINFRETTREAPDWERCRAPLLPWWRMITEGLETCRLTVEKEVRTIEDVKDWASRALAPTLAVLQQVAGPAWMTQMFEEGERRWRTHHRRLLTGTQPKRTYGLRPPKPHV